MRAYSRAASSSRSKSEIELELEFESESESKSELEFEAGEGEQEISCAIAREEQLGAVARGADSVWSMWVSSSATYYSINKQKWFQDERYINWVYEG